MTIELKFELWSFMTKSRKINVKLISNNSSLLWHSDFTDIETKAVNKKKTVQHIEFFYPHTVVPSPSIRCKRRILENDKRLSKIGGRGTWKEKFAERVRRFSMHAGIHQIESEFGKFTCSALNLQMETGTQEIIRGVLL